MYAGKFIIDGRKTFYKNNKKMRNFQKFHCQ